MTLDQECEDGTRANVLLNGQILNEMTRLQEYFQLH